MAPKNLKIAVPLLAVGLLAVGDVFAAAPRDDPDRPTPKKAIEGGKPTAGVPTVRLVRPQPGGLDRVLTQLATAQAYQEVDLLPRVAGFIKQVTVDIGDQVKAGQLLAEIDAPNLVLDERLAVVGVEQAHNSIREAEARLVTAKAEIVVAKSVIRRREAEVVAAKATLFSRQKQYERLKDLFNRKSVDQRTLEEAEEQLRSAEALVEATVVAVETAQADLEVTNSKLNQAETALVSAKLNVEVAKLGLEKARLALAQTRIVAPFDGVVTRRTCFPGSSVRPGDRMDSESLFTLMRIEVVRVVVAIPGRFAAMVEPGVLAKLEFEGLPGIEMKGKLARVALAVDPKERTMRAEIDLPNPKENVRPGMVGRVSLMLGKGPPDAVRVPVGVLFHRVPRPVDEKANSAVYVYRDGKARLTRVLVGYEDGREAEILSGLTTDDRVVLDPQGVFTGEDVPVEVEKPSPPNTKPSVVLPFDPTTTRPVGIVTVEKDPPLAKAGDTEESFRKAMLEDARKVFEQDLKRYRGFQGPGVEELCQWSSRWADAELDLAADAAAKTAALKAHLDRMKEVEKMTAEFAKVGQGRESEAAAGRYYRTQAELWLVRGRVK